MQRVGTSLLGIALAVSMFACGGSGSSAGASGGVGSGGSSGSGATASGGGSGSGGGGGSGGNSGSSGSGGAGSSAGSGGASGAPAWSATPEWTSLPIPLQFGPSIAPHPTDAKTFTILSNAYTPTENTLIATTTSDLGSSFVTSAPLVPIGKTSMAEPSGIAYSSKNSQDVAAVVWIQGPPEDPSGGGHVFVSNDGAKSFVDSPLVDALPFNALYSSGVRYASDGSLALRVDDSIVYSSDGKTVSATVDTPGCAGAFDLDPTDGKRVAVACDKSVAFCASAGCTKTNLDWTIVEVRFGADADHVAAIGRADDSASSFVALASDDGGKTFKASPPFTDNVSPSWHVEWDPRPGKNVVYALLVSHLFRSTDAGATWQDITPPPELNYIYDFVVGADGTVIGRGVFHYLVLAPEA